MSLQLVESGNLEVPIFQAILYLEFRKLHTATEKSK